MLTPLLIAQVLVPDQPPSELLRSLLRTGMVIKSTYKYCLITAENYQVGQPKPMLLLTSGILRTHVVIALPVNRAHVAA